MLAGVTSSVEDVRDKVKKVKEYMKYCLEKQKIP
jgi:hypothetical protein